MSVRPAKGARGHADILFSRIVRSRGLCERCGREATDTAHIVGRRFSATRCLEDNAWALCNSCHRLTGEAAHEFMFLVERTIGVDRYKQLWDLAQEDRKFGAVFWTAEVERLKARCIELGLDSRRRVPS